ncbi:phosphoribosyltransferase [Poseidonocella sp. HB161398]|uniref:phosphoribosyltransferase n=1 Tax=Poseidonocella sp. HB161398 TaxID=2320855 RepID=UPI0011091C2D|nr:phosphoribosyltransferase [Poseidonocella sp. HB161398]
MEPHAFWQAVEDGPAPPPPYEARFPAELPGGRILWLPTRELAGTQNALASLILNQASFAVEEALAADLAEALRPHAPELLVGLPTLGLGLAAAVARQLGHRRYLPLGTSRKFWYDEALSVPLKSVTSPGGGKRLYLDPRMRPLLAGRRVAVIDDALSTGSSMKAALGLLGLEGIRPVAIGAAMLQTERWRVPLGPEIPVCGVFRSPLLERRADGLWPVAEAKAD